jgi:mannosyltransferase
VTDETETKGINFVLENSSVLLIASLGLFLRVWQLGGKNFWLDELGVANAAFQPTLLEALEAANEHIMAMPLDYIVAWIMARWSQAEGWLRLPEALWGCFTLLAGYKLSLKLSSNRRVAFFTLLMLALSPILITYSQELRFYAPLIFFFTLSLYFGLEAVQQSRPKDWLTFTLVTMVGIYFHLYTILAVGTVLLWLAAYFGRDNWEQRRNTFAISALVLAVAFLIGMFKFGGVYAERKLSLFMYESFSSFLFNGLGWTPAIPASPAGWILGFLFMLFASLGVITSVRQNPVSPASLLFYGVVLQVMMVLVFDIFRNYPLFARQIVMLVPPMIYFSACGVDWAIGQMTNRWNASIRPAWITACFGAIFVLAAIPSLGEYYQLRKGSLHDISAALSSNWQTSEPIHVEAGVLEVYAYYWAQDPENQVLVSSLTPMDYASPNGWNYPQPAWFIIDYPPMNGTDKALQSAGFFPVYIPASNTLHPQMLWHRE